MGKIAIFGFGRIGRQLLRAALQERLFVPYSISDIKDESTLAALFEVDTNYKRWQEAVSSQEGAIIIGGREIRYLNSSSEVPNWRELGVELVIDCTGRAVTRPVAHLHLDRGAKRVLVSGPSKSLEDCDAVLLKGINLGSFDPDKHKIISMASCTTNALAPVVKLVRENYGLKYGLFSTVHSYTNTQSLTDQPMKDRRDSWAAAENIIPSSSGAAKALKFIWSDLQITGKAYRIPTRTGSIAELNLITEISCSVQEINEMFRLAAKEGELKGILNILEGEWASSRIVGDPHSSIIDLPLTQVQGELVSVAAWYDNEWGYASRLAEVAAFLVSR
ncbi:type I glyceraldehyde-3-phosphate dehydrogenase [Paenibacillus harenae]|uniref:type I glyceraldehyde-3-phosphate dehydrogenase n=1 Tax=Paenibacillus harenae TaxID=306543 RepID=UPI0004197AFD|nr:glyceraldehyde 3-phosphate dehydrogenase NAD-binding domain-containing protein [Paenibacillus harenae]